jgi:hypothetical protein
MRRRGGPTPYLTLDLAVKVDQGAEAHRLPAVKAHVASTSARPRCPTPMPDRDSRSALLSG